MFSKFTPLFASQWNREHPLTVECIIKIGLVMAVAPVERKKVKKPRKYLEKKILRGGPPKNMKRR